MLHPLTPSFAENPYPTFAKLRSENPIYFDEEIGMWVITRYDDIRIILTDAETFSNAMTLAPIFSICEHAGKALGGLTVEPVAVLDAPNHTRTRKAINHAFPSTPQKAQEYESLIRQRVIQSLNKMDRAGEVDLVREFTWELPILVILTLLGVPEEDFEQIKRWSDGQISLVWGHVSAEEQVRLAHGLVDFSKYCQQLVDKQKDHPKEDFIGALLKYRNGDDQVLSLKEIASIAFAFLIAGHETTSNLLSNGTFHLLTTEGAWDKLIEEPHLIPQAVEEMLRFDPPVIGWLRLAVKDASVGGVNIPKGQRILVLLGSANRDETYFANADQFLMERKDAKEHISFSAGPHFCVGAALARLEAKVALEELTKRFPKMKLKKDFQPVYVPNVGFRAMQSLPVVLY